MSITKRPFGTLKDGTPVTCWTLTSENGMVAEVIDYGATIRTIVVPDKNGNPVDVVLGYDDIDGYVNNGSYYGATIGRFGNRIREGKFTLNGVDYTLAVNDGPNHLHGGIVGFDKRVWDSVEVDGGVKFTLVSPDGEEGYPGTLTVDVTMKWVGNGLQIHYDATTDKDTPLNLTNHSYFNLNGKGDVQDQLLMINSDAITLNDEHALPTGEIWQVADTAVDFREEHTIGERADNDDRSVIYSHGYDNNFILKGSPASIARSCESGIVMTTYTDEPGVQLYTCNGMPERVGKNGAVYGHRAAFCLETQHNPDSINHPEWPSCVLKAGDKYSSTTTYEFSVKK